MPLIVCGVMLDSTEPSQPLRSHMLSVHTPSLPLFLGGSVLVYDLWICRKRERECLCMHSIEFTLNALHMHSSISVCALCMYFTDVCLCQTSLTNDK